MARLSPMRINMGTDLLPAFRARAPRGLGGYAPLWALLDYDPLRKIGASLFFKTEMIKLLESMDINFIMPAVRNEKVKRILNEYAKGNIPSVIEYGMGSKVYLVIARKKGSREEDKPVDKFIAFVTNIKFDDPQRIVGVIPEEYRYRWGIEKSYRVEDGFEAKTTSRNLTLIKEYIKPSLNLIKCIQYRYQHYTGNTYMRF